MLIPMCKKCLDEYEIPHPAFTTFDSKCACCDKDFITVCQLSTEALDKFNEDGTAVNSVNTECVNRHPAQTPGDKPVRCSRGVAQ
jgi:hypothetical protein